MNTYEKKVLALVKDCNGKYEFCRLDREIVYKIGLEESPLYTLMRLREAGYVDTAPLKDSRVNSHTYIITEKGLEALQAAEGGDL